MKHDPYTHTCELSTGPHSAPAAGIITYEIHSTGSAYVSSVTYHGADGPVTVQEPTLPFTVSLPVQQNAVIGMQIKGTSIEGALKIRHALKTAAETVTAHDGCEG